MESLNVGDLPAVHSAAEMRVIDARSCVDAEHCTSTQSTISGDARAGQLTRMHATGARSLRL